MTNDISQLTEAIATAAKTAFLSLFANGERHYYCTLLTTGEGHCPFISAWSWEALEKKAADTGDPEDAELLKWSFADSPYYAYGDDHFTMLKELFAERPSIDDLEDEDWDIELRLRLSAMEKAMKKLDDDGIFMLNQPRESLIIAVAFMVPDMANGEIASRLNKPSPLLDEYMLVMGSE